METGKSVPARVGGRKMTLGSQTRDNPNTEIKEDTDTKSSKYSDTVYVITFHCK